MSDELKAEYQFDYKKVKPNRFATDMHQGGRLVVLDPEVGAGVSGVGGCEQGAEGVDMRFRIDKWKLLEALLAAALSFAVPAAAGADRSTSGGRKTLNFWMPTTISPP